MKGFLAGRFRNSVRLRFTLLYGGMFLIAGAVLIAVLYLVSVLNLPSVDRAIAVQTKPFVVPGENVAPGESARVLPTTPYQVPSSGVRWARALQSVELQRADAVWTQLRWSLLALLAVGAAALAFGWMMAGRVLRPVRDITSTARRVADRSLHERINLPGPNDEFKELADTFDAMLDRLDRSFDGQRSFVANASHELRTPIAVNRTLLEVTMAHNELTPEVRQMLRTLVASNERSEQLIDGLLTLARSERQGIGTDPVDLSDVAADALEQTAYEASHAKVEIDAEPNPAVTSGDRALLERLALNLVQNAVRHNHPGGSVHVRTGQSELPGQVELLVTNTGPVLRPPELERLFEPFHRRRPGATHRDLPAPAPEPGQDRTDQDSAGHDPSPSPAGAGLGLSIVRMIARTHGGEVRAEARPSGGLVLRVTLPARSDP